MAACSNLSRNAVAAGIVTATAPSVPASFDYAEAQTVPYILGIPHETGFPAYVLAGWAFSHAFAVGTVAWRLNVFAGLWTAAATGGGALLAAELGANAVAAGLAALLFAFGPAVFAGTHADARAMLLAFVVFGLLFALRYAHRGAGHDLIAAGLCCGLGLAIHPDALFVLISLGAAVLVRRGVGRRAGVLTLAAIVLPLALYAYLPLRSAAIAARHLDPTAAPPLSGAGTIAWDTNHPRTLNGFLAFRTSPADVPRYLVPAFAVAAAIAGNGVRLTLQPRRLDLAATVVLTAALAFATGSAFATGREAAWRARTGPGGQPAIDAVARDVPDGAVVVTPWADATTLAYGAFIEHALGTRIVAVGDVAPIAGPVRLAPGPSSDPTHRVFEVVPSRDRPGHDPN